MVGDFEKSPELAACLSASFDEILRRWTQLVQAFSGPRVGELSLSEIRGYLEPVLRDYVEMSRTATLALFDNHAAIVLPEVVAAGLPLGEVTEVHLLLRDAVLPFIETAATCDSHRRTAIIGQLSTLIRNIVHRLADKYSSIVLAHLREQQRRTALLLEAAQVASSSLDLDDVAERIGAHLASALGVPTWSIYAVDPVPGTLRLAGGGGAALHASGNLLDQAYLDVDSVPGLWEVLETGEPRTGQDMARALGVREAIVVPYMSGGEVLGVGIVYSLEDREPFSPEDVRLAQGIASTAGMVTKSARLYDETRRRLAETQGLQRVAFALLKETNLGAVLDIVCTEAQQLTGATGGAVWMLESEGLLRLAHSTGRPGHPVTLLPIDLSLAGLAIRSRETLLANAPADYAPAFERNPDVTALLAAPLIKDSAVIGVLEVFNKPHGFGPDDIRIANLFAAHAAVAIEHARLQEQSEELAVIEERQRLARELHDSVTQSLYSIILYADAAAMTLSHGKHEATAKHLQVLRDSAQDTMREMRLLVFELHPPALEEEGLAAALRMRLAAVEARAGFETEFKSEGEASLPVAVQEEIYQIAQEILNNAVKHAHAKRVSVDLRFMTDTISLDIRDDGIGFDVAGARAGGGFGLTSIQERAARLGGKALVESEANRGTKVTVEIPVPGEADRASWPGG